MSPGGCLRRTSPHTRVLIMKALEVVRGFYLHRALLPFVTIAFFCSLLSDRSVLRHQLRHLHYTMGVYALCLQYIRYIINTLRIAVLVRMENWIRESVHLMHLPLASNDAEDNTPRSIGFSPRKVQFPVRSSTFRVGYYLLPLSPPAPAKETGEPLYPLETKNLASGSTASANPKACIMHRSVSLDSGFPGGSPGKKFGQCLE